MKRIILTLIALSCFSLRGYSQSDSLKVSTAFTTHVIFPTELTYADLSNKEVVAAKIIEQNKNILAVKARCFFEDMTSISALESNGRMHTFIAAYDQYPATLVIDLRKEATMTDGNVSLMRKSDAPTLEEVVAYNGPQKLDRLLS